MTDNVTPFRGVLTPPAVKDPHPGVIAMLERLLQEARAGEIVGFSCAYHGPDWRAGYAITGFIGGYSMLGAAQCVVSELVDINRGLAADHDED
jgi:hypothetical protein